MLSYGKTTLVLAFSAVLAILVLAAYGDSGGRTTQGGGYPVVTFYVA